MAEAVGPAAHLLDDSYEALFTDEERKIGSALRNLETAASNDSLSAGVRVAVRSALDAIRGQVVDKTVATAPSSLAPKGSRRQTQLYVNRRTEALEDAIRRAMPDLRDASFEWRSPLEDDGFIEYRDGAFLEQL